MSELGLKILQLEADHPLWEAAKKKREENERAEHTKVEERRWAEEVEESRKKMREFQKQDREAEKRKEHLQKEEEENAYREEEERKAREKLEHEKRWRAATQAEAERCQKHNEMTWGAGGTLFRELKLKSKGHMQRIVLADVVRIVGGAGGDVVLRVVAGTMESGTLQKVADGNMKVGSKRGSRAGAIFGVNVVGTAATDVHQRNRKQRKELGDYLVARPVPRGSVYDASEGVDAECDGMEMKMNEKEERVRYNTLASETNERLRSQQKMYIADEIYNVVGGDAMDGCIAASKREGKTPKEGWKGRNI
ncbi:hypothetical protein DFH08DRAFT_798209 [Mycena albidolilacea]|uniref:Uncharacterized protein n=1 Tax=Mycena albidolilacea TaxID=1033008 RepID=A0AAD7F369_9AGAR|nr:hypothetical protein DFH08DRAFT_798209 [Mycena albidolilacea]